MLGLRVNVQVMQVGDFEMNEHICWKQIGKNSTDHCVTGESASGREQNKKKIQVIEKC